MAILLMDTSRPCPSKVLARSVLPCRVVYANLIVTTSFNIVSVI